jgi:hypothetical protein
MQVLNINELKPHTQNNYFFDDIQGDNWTEFKKSIQTSGVIEPVIYYTGQNYCIGTPKSKSM